MAGGKRGMFSRKRPGPAGAWVGPARQGPAGMVVVGGGLRLCEPPRPGPGPTRPPPGAPCWHRRRSELARCRARRLPGPGSRGRGGRRVSEAKASPAPRVSLAQWLSDSEAVPTASESPYLKLGRQLDTAVRVRLQPHRRPRPGEEPRSCRRLCAVAVLSLTSRLVSGPGRKVPVHRPAAGRHQNLESGPGPGPAAPAPARQV